MAVRTKWRQAQFSRRVEGVGFTFHVMGMIAGATIRQLQSSFRAEGIEAVAFDTYLPYLELSAMALDLPYAHVAVAVPFDVTGEAPLCFFDWDDSKSPESRRRQFGRGGHLPEAIDSLLGSGAGICNRAWPKGGLERPFRNDFEASIHHAIAECL